MVSTVVSASRVPTVELDALTKLQQELPADSPLRFALHQLSDSISEGVDVALTRDDELLSPAHAAAILGISRTHLYKILDAGDLSFTIVGKRDRRISSRDLRIFADRTEAFRASDAVSIARRDELEDSIIDSME